MPRLRLGAGAGTPPYLRLVQQARQSLLLGYLPAGDQLPTVQDMTADLAINPNTVAGTYRQLGQEGVA